MIYDVYRVKEVYDVYRVKEVYGVQNSTCSKYCYVILWQNGVELIMKVEDL